VETLFALLFILISVSLAGAAFALMWKNISDISKVNNNYVESKKTITKIPHPELLEVKPGDELMVVNFKEQGQSDPIYKSLQERIDELTEEDDEDDDGDIVVRT
tara:strand:+ start:2534 stop:2845 length:312 start_codon:yes stop_codon:yes gene_type:complete